MSTNILQYAPIFRAANIRLDLDSYNLDLRVIDAPKSIEDKVDKCLREISLYESTATQADVMAAIACIESIDNEPINISDRARKTILTSLGLMDHGKFISQELATLKVNRSWHISPTPNRCDFFGDICTHRGIENVPGKRGRKSYRDPEEYHAANAQGKGNREQLVTPALEELYRAIPQSNLISKTKNSPIIDVSRMSAEELREMASRLEALIGAANETANANA
jgi:hypothetical protein